MLLAIETIILLEYYVLYGEFSSKLSTVGAGWGGGDVWHWREHGTCKGSETMVCLKKKYDTFQIVQKKIVSFPLCIVAKTKKKYLGT